MTDACVFCKIINGESGAAEFKRWNESVVSFRPLNPVVNGHLLFVPVICARGASTDPFGASLAFEMAAYYGKLRGEEDCNIITSNGIQATQTIFHTHIHYVPRRPGDGLMLPWTEHYCL